MKERIEHIFQHCEYDTLTESEHELLISFEEQFRARGDLTSKQLEVLEDIFRKAAAR